VKAAQANRPNEQINVTQGLKINIPDNNKISPTNGTEPGIEKLDIARIREQKENKGKSEAQPL
jgi:hypothetical protein